jgi:hypothetical protein
MERTVYIVAADSPELYAYLRNVLSDDGETEVIRDRRVSERRRYQTDYAPERRQGERRSRPHVDAELATRCHAVLTFPVGVVGLV